MKNQLIPFEITGALEKATKAMNARIRLNHRSAPGSADEKKAAEYEVHLTTRELFSIFVIDAGWSGWSGTNAKTKRVVGDALRKATRCVTVDKNCVKSVEQRLDDFNKFLHSLKNKDKKKWRKAA